MGAFEVFRPFAWLALAAFLAGFCSYLVLGQPRTAAAEEEWAPAAIPTSSGPVSDEWNVARRI